MSRMRLLGGTVLTSMVLAGCANFGGPVEGEITPEERRLRQIESQIETLNRRLEAMSSVDVATTAQRLAEEVRSLRGATEQLRHDVDSNEQRARKLYLDLDRRIQRLEGSGAADAGVGSGVAAAASGPADPEEEKAYLAAFELLKAGKYPQAISGFEAMRQQWPRGRYADNAMYWTGEAQYVQRDYRTALSTFEGLLSQFPSSSKASDAMLKVAFAQRELNQMDQSKRTLQQLIEQYPNSSAAGLARQRLDQLNRPG